MNQSINTDSKNSKEPQQKYRLGTVSIALWSKWNSAAFVFVESSSFSDLLTTIAFVPADVPSECIFRPL